MGRITTDQSHEVMATLATNTSWGEIDFELAGLQNAIIRDPESAGRRFTDFLKKGGRFIINDPKLVVTKSFNPARFFGKNCTIWRGSADGDGFSGENDIDSRSLTFSEIRLNEFLFGNCLKEGEEFITGEEMLRRLKEENSDLIRFGGNVFLSLWLDYDRNRKGGILGWFYQNVKVSYMAFFGLILRGSDGIRYVPVFVFS